MSEPQSASPASSRVQHSSTSQASAPPPLDEFAPLLPVQRVEQPHRAGIREEVRVVLRALRYLFGTPWRLLQERGTVEIRRDVVYREGSQNPKHRLDLYLPPGERRGIPFVLFIHGGYWKDGDRRYLAPVTGLYGNLGRVFARAGIGAAVVSYRLKRETSIEGQLSDVAAAVGWLMAHVASLGGTPGRVVLAGHSAGGQLAMMLRLDPTHLQAVGVDAAGLRGVINLSGVLDIDDLYARQSEAKRTEITDPVFGRERARRQRFSPTSYMQQPLPPMLTVIGDKDYREIYAQSQLLRERLAARGESCAFIELIDHTHEDLVLNIGKPWDEVSPPLIRFVQEVCSERQ